MMKLLEPAKRFRLRYWDRTFGPEFPPFELSAIKEFYEAARIARPSLSGFVKRLGRKHFALLPTLYSTQIHLVCTCPKDMRLPPENAYIHLEGERRWRTRERIDRRDKTQGEKEVIVEKWDLSSPEWLKAVKPNMSFDEFKDNIFANVFNLEPSLRNFVGYLITSSPSFEEFLGGLNLSIYSESRNTPARSLVSQIRKQIPRDIGKPYRVNTVFGDFSLRYKHIWTRVDADRSLSKKVTGIMTDRTARTIPFDEVCLSLASAKTKPLTLDEPPCTLSDLPIVVNPEVEVIKKDLDPNLEVFRYMQIQHYTNPIVEDMEETVSSRVCDRLIKLQTSYEVPPHLLGRFNFLDASYRGKPQSILRLALAEARTQNKNSVSTEGISHAVQAFAENFDNNYEAWRELFTEEARSVRAKIMYHLSPDERRIVKTIERLRSSREKCVSINEIAADLPDLERYVLEQLIDDLYTKRRLLIERSSQCYDVINL